MAYFITEKLFNVFVGVVFTNRCVHASKDTTVNSISTSGMLTGQWKVKPRWLPMEGNFVRVRLLCTQFM